MEYGVQTHNKFAFLDEDVSDPEETLTKAEEEKKKAAAHPPLKKPENVKEKSEQVPEETTQHKEKREKIDVAFVDKRFGGSARPGFGGGADRNERPPLRGDRERGGDYRQGGGGGEYRQGGGGGGGDRLGQRGGGGSGRGGAGGQGGGRGAGQPRNNYGSGPAGPSNRRPPNKQGGKPKEDDNNDEKPAAENEENEVTDGQKVNDENVDNNGGEEKKGDEEDEEQVPRGKTYEEYKAELKQKEIESVQFNTRKPGEGDDDKIYQKLVPLKKPENLKEKSEQVPEETTQHKEKREKTLSIDVAFVDKRFGGSARPGFGGGADRNERPPQRGDRERGGDYRQGGGEYRQGGGGGGGDRQGQRGGGGPGRGSAGGQGGGRGAGQPRNNYGSGPAGPSNRRPPNKQGGEFTLENDQFPALGAK